MGNGFTKGISGLGTSSFLRNKHFNIAILTLGILISSGVPAFAVVTVSTVGGKSINLDTRFGGPSSSFTTIDAPSPRITESAAGDIATSITITAPSGWAFSVVSNPVAIPIAPSNIVLGPATVFPFVITIPVVTPSTTPGPIEIAGIQMRPSCSNAPGLYNIPVTTDTGGAGDLSNATLATVTLVAGPTLASYALSSNSPQAAGSPISVTLEARDGCGYAIPNATVPSDITLEADLTGAALPVWGDGAPFVLTNKNVVPNQATIAAASVFDANGQGTFTVTSNCADSITLSATEGTAIADASTPLVWNSPGTNAATSLVAVQGVPPNPIADNVDTRTIQVTLRDACNLNIAGNQVSLSVQSVSVGGDASAITITAVSATTDASGQASFQVKSSLAQTATFRATDTTAAVDITATVDVTFVANTADTGNSTVVAVPPSVRADGIEASTITITLLNSLGNPVVGHAIALTNGLGSVIVAPAVAGVVTTDANGMVSFTARSTTPQVAMLTFSDTTGPQIDLAPVAVGFIADELRAQYSHKGDLFVWPYVVIVWNNQGTASNADDVFLQDVFITVTNDDCNLHRFRMQFVDGMDCLDFDRTFQLTQSNPVYFSALDGQGGGFSGDPNGSVPSFRGINNIGDPADPLNPNIRFVGGYIVGWTVDASGAPVGSNQLSAGAVVVDYRTESVWEYKAWSYRSLWIPTTGIPCGAPSPVKPGDPSLLLLDGVQYQTTPSVLLLDFFATGSPGFGPALAPIAASTSDFELTLLTAKFHFEAQPDFDNNGVFQLPNNQNDCVRDSEPAIGGVDVLAFNEDEQPVSETVHCVQCWDSTLASLYGFQGEESPFALALLGTDKAYARIRGVLDSRCDRAGLPNGNPPIRCIQSQDLPLLGIAHKIIRWGAGNARVTKAASHLTAAGQRADGFVRTNPPQGQPPTAFIPDPIADGPNTTPSQASGQGKNTRR